MMVALPLMTFSLTLKVSEVKPMALSSLRMRIVATAWGPLVAPPVSSSRIRPVWPMCWWQMMLMLLLLLL